MVSAKIIAPIVIVLALLVGAGVYGSTLTSSQGRSSTTGASSSSTSSKSTSTTGNQCNGCTTLESIVAGTYPTATDKLGDGGTTVTVQGLQVTKVLTESDGDWHVYVTDGKLSVFISEIIPRDQAAEGKPAPNSVIDETGTPYCDKAHATEAWHGDTCWEIHPVTSWHLSTQAVTVTTTNTAQELNVTISYAHDPIVRGSNQTITVSASDSDGPMAGRAMTIHVTYASGSTTKDYSCTTKADGTCSYSWVIGSGSDPGTFTVVVTFEGTQYHSSFQVTV